MFGKLFGGLGKAVAPGFGSDRNRSGGDMGAESPFAKMFNKPVPGGRGEWAAGLGQAVGGLGGEKPSPWWGQAPEPAPPVQQPPAAQGLQANFIDGVPPGPSPTEPPVAQDGALKRLLLTRTTPSDDIGGGWRKERDPGQSNDAKGNFLRLLEGLKLGYMPGETLVGPNGERQRNHFRQMMGFNRQF